MSKRKNDLLIFSLLLLLSSFLWKTNPEQQKDGQLANDHLIANLSSMPNAAPTFVGSNSALNANNVNNLTINVPSGSVDDLLLAFITTDDNETINIPAGWTLYNQGFDANNSVTLAVFYRIADGSEPGNYTFTWGSTEETLGVILRYAGVDTANPIQLALTQTGNSNTPDAPSITTTTDDTEIIYVFAQDADYGDQANPQPTGTTDVFSERSSGIGNDAASLNIATKSQLAAGATGVGEFTTRNTDDWRAMTLAIAPMPSGGGGTIPTGNLTCSAAATEITGTVFEDFNYNGTYNTFEHLGVKGVAVVATDSLGNTFNTATDASGNYTFAGLSTNRTYRIAFTIPDSLSWAKPTFYNGDNGTSIQFVQSGNCANLGVTVPEDFCETNPFVAIACYENGDGTGNNNVSLLKYNYADDGIPTQYGGSAANPTTLATIAQIGSVWGTAYRKKSTTIYTTASLKRHVSLGPLGLGGVYIVDPNAGYTGSFDLAGVTPNNGGTAMDFGTITRTTVTEAVNGDNQLSTNANEATVDLDAFTKVGAVGMGDTDISEDGNTLWTINLNTSETALVSIDLTDQANPLPTDGSNPASAIVNRYLFSNMSTPTCNAGVFRPWGLGFHQGKGYVGGVCSAESNGAVTDLVAYLLSFDPQNPTAGFTVELSFPLNFNRELKSDFGHEEDADWQPWADQWSDLTFNQGRYVVNATPIFSDIEFRENGDLILGFLDRNSMQLGYQQFAATSGAAGGALYDTESAGDIYHVCLENGSLVLEGAGSCTDSDAGTVVASSLTNDGPNGVGEYYWDDVWRLGNGPGHGEIASGGLAYLLGTGNVVSSALDPVEGGNATANTQGTIKFNTSNGVRAGAYLVVDNNGTGLGKSGGIGEPLLICAPAPIEIGNYVWLDTNGDGIQDAGESGIDSVRVELYDALGNLLAFDTTNALGQYYFSGEGTDDAQWLTSNDTILPETTYYIVAGAGQYDVNGLATNGENYFLTISNTNSNMEDAIDNDGTIATAIDPDFDGNPYLQVTTGDYGIVDHSLDFGFRADPVNYDYGDLPDIANGTTGILDYETYDSTGGPSHLIVEGLFLGDTVDVDLDGAPDAQAFGDDTGDGFDDEDGVTIFPSLTVSPGRLIRLPLSFTNATGESAYIEGWIDWDGDGDFDETNEMVINVDDIADGVISTFITITVPDDAITGSLLGFRIRISNTNMMTPYGRVNSGEVEDYLIGVNCPQLICLPIGTELKRE